MPQLRHRFFFLTATLLLWGGFTTLVYSHAVELNSAGLFVGHEYLWSDWAQHIALTQIFATKPVSLWFAYHPTFADGKLTYAFLTNLVSSFFLRAGFSLETAMIFPSVLFMLGFLAATHRLLARLLRSEAQAFLAISLFFCSAGLGAFAQIFSGQGLFEFKSTLSSLKAYSWDADNFFIGMLLPQRAFLLGVALSSTALLFLWQALEEKKNAQQKLLLAALCVGLLPIAHMHSLISLCFILAPVGLLWLKRDWKKAALFATPAAVIACTLYFIFVSGGIQTKGFMRFNPGLATHGPVDWIWFWLRAFGPTLPLAIAGWLSFRHEPKPRFMLFSGFFLLFIAANLIQFQPTLWDNSKLFLWTYLGFAALASRVLAALWTTKAKRILASALVFTSIFTGAVELSDLLNWEAHRFRLLSPEDLRFAEKIRSDTYPTARFASAPTHDHPLVVWAARPMLMGYEGWVMNFGFDYHQVKADLEAIYSAKEGFQDLVKKHRVSYIYVGPAERRAYQINEAALHAAYQVELSSTEAEAYVLRAY